MKRELNEIDLKIIELYESGISTSIIGQQFGKTRSAICGLLFRYREHSSYVFKRTSKQYPATHRNKGPKITTTPNKRVSKQRLDYLFKAKTNSLPKDDRPRFIPNPSILPPVTDGISFWNIKKTSCRYILNDDKPELFCGEPIHYRSYCHYHASICYVKPEKPAHVKITVRPFR